MEWRTLPLLMFDRMDPSSATGGASNEAGPSTSVNGEVATGLVGVTVVTGVEPGEGAGKV